MDDLICSNLGLWSNVSDFLNLPEDVAAKAHHDLSAGYQTLFHAILKSITNNEDKIKRISYDKACLEILTSIVSKAKYDVELESSTKSNCLLPITKWSALLNEILNLCSSALGYLFTNQGNSFSEEHINETHSFCAIICDSLSILWKLREYSLCKKFITELTNEISSYWTNTSDVQGSSVTVQSVVQKLMVSLITVLQNIKFCDTSGNLFVDETECRLFQLALEILKQGEPSTTTFAIIYFFPIITPEENTEIAKKIWDVLITFYDEVGDDLVEVKPTGLVVLCSLWDICYGNLCGNTIVFALIDYEHFWKIIQFGLAHNHPLHRKRSQYLLKRALDYCSIADQRITVSKSDKCVLFCWDPLKSEEIKKVWDDYLILLEVIEEKQVHIIKPLLNKMDNLMKTALSSCDSSQRLDVSWLLLLLKR